VIVNIVLKICWCQFNDFSIESLSECIYHHHYSWLEKNLLNFDTITTITNYTMKEKYHHLLFIYLFFMIL
jgi:hypothetical protein